MGRAVIRWGTDGRSARTRIVGLPIDELRHYPGSAGLNADIQPKTSDRDRMNDLTNFLALTAAIFLAITVLLVLLSHLEPQLTNKKVDPGS